MADLIKLGGLWKNKDKNGRAYLAGKLSPTVRILIFTNEFKTEERQPDYQIYLAPVETPEEGGRPAPAEDDFLDVAPSLPAEPTEVPARPAPAPAPRTPPAATRPAPAPAPGRTAPPRPAPRQAPRPEFTDDMEDPFADNG
jgi:hypothetical protein